MFLIIEDFFMKIVLNCLNGKMLQYLLRVETNKYNYHKRRC